MHFWTLSLLKESGYDVNVNLSSSTLAYFWVYWYFWITSSEFGARKPLSPWSRWPRQSFGFLFPRQTRKKHIKHIVENFKINQNTLHTQGKLWKLVLSVKFTILKIYITLLTDHKKFYGHDALVWFVFDIICEIYHLDFFQNENILYG